jgi:RNA recognition motif-containing protein
MSLLNHLLTLTSKEVHIVFKGPRSMGYGFVTFENESDIDKAVEVLKGHELDGRELNVERCQPRSERPARERRQQRGSQRERKPRGPPSDTMIYVGNLPYSMTSEDLTNMMSEYKVSGCYVVTRPNGSSKGFGFVNAATNEEQMRILNEMKDCTCDDRRINIRAATSEGPYGTMNPSGDGPGDEALSEH